MIDEPPPPGEPGGLFDVVAGFVPVLIPIAGIGLVGALAWAAVHFLKEG